MANLLKPGTACMLKSPAPWAQVHRGKVVVVVKYLSKERSYLCAPQLKDKEGYILTWIRSSLRPLDGGDGQDEMLRITGKAEDAHA